jgi:hypothetical protein
MHTVGTYYRNQLNPGFAINVTQLLYASSYDKGEGWTSGNIDSVGLLTGIHNNLHVYAAGPDATFHFTAFGKEILPRRIGVRINNTVVDTTLRMNFFDAARKTYTIPLSLLSTNAASVEFDNIAISFNDKMVIAKYELTYPHAFDFGGATNFEFRLPALNVSRYLEINGFSYGAAAPVLYDLANGKRYIGDITAAPTVKFIIEASATEHRFVLASYEPTEISAIANLEERQFIDYTNAANIGDYIIITSERLSNSADGTNPVEEYRSYRSSALGGGYNAKIYLESELTDQFGFGIKKHPIALRNFLLYARNRYSPKHVFIIGKGVNYTGQYYNQAHPDIDKLNLVPTFGWPASDALFTADPGSSIPQLPFGRLSAINKREVTIYLNKVKEFEQAQFNLSPERKDREWMKNVVHINGISEPVLKSSIDAYFNKYKNIISDTLFGGRVITFSKSSTAAVEQISSSYLEQLFKTGITLMTYFGHSGATSLEFNLDNPQSYENKGKYPLFIVLGCSAGDFLILIQSASLQTKRFQRNMSLRRIVEP